MTEGTVTDAVARRFLLGDVDADERRRIESLFISDTEINRKILIAEEDLIEDYLENSLTASDRDKFLAHYGYTPQQRRKLRIAKSIKEYALAEAALTQTASPTIPKWRTLLSSLRPRRPMFFIPVAATLMIALVVAVLWLVEWNRKRVQENNQHLAIERELADLNAPSGLRETPPQLLSIVLVPVSVRGVEPQTELTPRTDTRVVQLRLLWMQKEQYPSYRASLRRVGSIEQFTISNLRLEKEPEGSAVRVELPAHVLTRGLYQVNLSGITGDGAAGLTVEYSFTVGG